MADEEEVVEEVEEEAEEPTEGDPAWGYRKKGDEVESKLFPNGLPSRGWADSPAKCE